MVKDCLPFNNKNNNNNNWNLIIIIIGIIIIFLIIIGILTLQACSDQNYHGYLDNIFVL